LNPVPNSGPATLPPFREDWTAGAAAATNWAIWFFPASLQRLALSLSGLGKPLEEAWIGRSSCSMTGPLSLDHSSTQRTLSLRFSLKLRKHDPDFYDVLISGRVKQPIPHVAPNTNRSLPHWELWCRRRAFSLRIKTGNLDVDLLVQSSISPFFSS